MARVFVLGVPCAGKTTVAQHLRSTLDATILDMDDEVVRLNGGVWPDIEAKNELVPQVLEAAASLDDVLLLNSYAQMPWTRRLRQAGFTIVLLDVLDAEQRRRDEQRQAAEGWTNREWFDWHRAVIDEHLAAEVIDVVIDGARPTEQVARDIAALVRP